MPEPDPGVTQRLAREALEAGDPTGWFDRLYTAADAGAAEVPWDRGEPHPLLAAWADRERPDGAGRSALVVGAGLGEDAELVGRLGYATTAFDISATAVAAARRRFPASPVTYRTADLLDPPPEWSRAFAFVFESMTVQSLPIALHAAAAANVGAFVAPGGTLLVIATGRTDDAPEPDGPPWPLTRAELDGFTADGLELVRAEAIAGDLLRWRAELRRPG